MNNFHCKKMVVKFTELCLSVKSFGYLPLNHIVVKQKHSE